MTDDTMCRGGGCPKKKRCWRHTAKPGWVQEFFADPPYWRSECPYFMDAFRKMLR